MANSKKKKKREPLRGAQIVGYVVMGALCVAAVLLGIACILFEHLIEGVIILGAVLVILFVTAELVLMDRRANKRKRIRSIGNVVMELKGVSLRWSDGFRDFGNVQLGVDGFVLDGDSDQITAPWVALFQYTVPNAHTVELWFAEDDRCRVTCNSDIKLKAMTDVLSKHVAFGGPVFPKEGVDE